MRRPSSSRSNLPSKYSRNHYVADGIHGRYLYAAADTKPFARQTHSQSTSRTLTWWTRCQQNPGIAQWAAASELDRSANVPDERAREVAPSQGDLESDDDSSDGGEWLGSEDNIILTAGNSRDSEEDGSDAMQLSSEPWRNDERTSSAISTQLAAQLNRLCPCGAIRPITKAFDSTQIAQYHLVAAMSPIATELIDPLLILPGELHRMSVEENANSKHTNYNSMPIKMLGVAYLVRCGGHEIELMPLDLYYLGYWLGDGDHSKPAITSSDAKTRA